MEIDIERRKYLGLRSGFNNFIKTFSSKIVRIDDGDYKGYISYLKIIEVNRPRMVGENSKQVCIADNGYSDISYLPDNENWQLCAIYDNNDMIIEWYFDITRKNSIDEEGKPYCDDLYLDIVLMPDGKIIILDEDELQNAFDNNKLSKKDFDKAYQTKEKLLKNGIVSVSFMEKFCTKLLNYINKNQKE
jgi:predicted RNA-binding protein associated with RNAse of E/G family